MVWTVVGGSRSQPRSVAGSELPEHALHTRNILATGARSARSAHEILKSMLPF